ncbi:MAG: hypothetical protein AAGJ40_15865 [Planctomycetota bacterium]
MNWRAGTTRWAVMLATAFVLLSHHAWSQVVQLPSTRIFSYSGSVAVPDRGATYLGGNSSAALGPGGSALSTRSLHAHATIIDLDAMDRQILGTDDALAEPRRMASGLRPADVHRQQALAMAMRQSEPLEGAAPDRLGVGQGDSTTPDRTKTMNQVIDRAKSLVRAARYSAAGDDPESAITTYRLAIDLLDRAAAVAPRLGGRRHTVDQLDPLRSHARFLANAARREFFGQFPSERLAGATKASGFQQGWLAKP